MSNKKLITIIIILAVIVVANIFGIFFLDNLLSKPIASYSVEVFGATFAESVSESNVVEINLIRPPRQVVNPGTTNLVNSKITNTHDEAIYVRATYKVDIENEDGIQTIGLHDDVSINTAEGWFYVDGYWYYEKPVDANCTKFILFLRSYFDFFRKFYDNIANF